MRGETLSSSSLGSIAPSWVVLTKQAGASLSLRLRIAQARDGRRHQLTVHVVAERRRRLYVAILVHRRRRRAAPSPPHPAQPEPQAGSCVLARSPEPPRPVWVDETSQFSIFGDFIRKSLISLKIGIKTMKSNRKLKEISSGSWSK